MLELPMLAWSRKLLMRVLKVSASRSQPRKGIWIPNWCSSSRSPWRGVKSVLFACANCTMGPVAVRRGGGWGKGGGEGGGGPVGLGGGGGAAEGGGGRVLV